MGKELHDGLVIDKSYLNIDEKKPGFRVSARIIQVLAIMIGCWSSISILVEGLNIPVDSMLLGTVIIFGAGIMFLLFMIPSLDLVKLFFVVLFYVLYLFSCLPKLANGFYILENYVVDRLIACYRYSGFYYVADYYSDVEDVTRLVIMIVIPMVVLLTIAIVRNRMIHLSILILFLPVLSSFLLGKIPSERYFIPYIIATLYLWRSGVSFRHIGKGEHQTLLHRINSRAAVWLSLICLFMFFVLKLFVPEKEYYNITQISDMKTDVQTAFLNVSIEDISAKFTKIKLFEYDSGSGGLRGGKLGKYGTVKYTDSEQLLVNAPISSLSEGIYLKGYVGSVYTGNSWEKYSSEDRALYTDMLKSLNTNTLQPVNQMNQLLYRMVENVSTDFMDSSEFISKFHIYKGTLEVEYKDANKKYIYAPYYTNYSLLDQIYYEQDLYAAPSEIKDEYEFNYFYNLSLGSTDYSLLSNLKGTTEDYARAEQAYRNYVYKVYTKLPEKGLEQIKKDFTDVNEFEEDTSAITKISYVKDYLSSHTEYTLSPGKLPKGKDYVEYFLYENKKGYCAHYASAATLMLRAMGLPARYVEGYSIMNNLSSQNNIMETQMVSVYSPSGKLEVEDQNSEIMVTDRNAHAWVEVYMDGSGWIPIDVTPGSTIEYNSDIVRDLANVDSYINKDNKNEDTPTTMPTQPTPTVSIPAEDKDNYKPDQTKNNLISYDKTGWNTLFFITFLLLAMISISVFLILRTRKHRKMRDSRNHNKKALYLYAEIQKLLLFCNGLPNRRAQLEDYEAYVKERSYYIETNAFDVCMKNVKKARFSNQSISSSELMEIETFRQNLYSGVYKDLSFRKKVHLKLILLM